MNLLLYRRREVVDGHLVLLPGDRRLLHLEEILQARAGLRIRVGEAHGSCHWATLMDDPAPMRPLRLRLDEAWQAPAPLECRRVLLLALPRPPVLRRILELAPQWHLHRLILLRSARVEKSYFHSPLLSKGEWRRHLEAGMEQARHTREPQVALFERFKPFVEDCLEEWLPAGATRLLPHPGPWPGVAGLPQDAAGSWVVAVGPEGGWVEAEVEAWRRHHFQPLSLGKAILRVEPAIHRLVAQLDLWHDMRSGVTR